MTTAMEVRIARLSSIHFLDEAHVNLISQHRMHIRLQRVFYAEDCAVGAQAGGSPPRVRNRDGMPPYVIHVRTWDTTAHLLFVFSVGRKQIEKFVRPETFSPGMITRRFYLAGASASSSPAACRASSFDIGRETRVHLSVAGVLIV